LSGWHIPGQDIWPNINERDILPESGFFSSREHVDYADRLYKLIIAQAGENAARPGTWRHLSCPVCGFTIPFSIRHNTNLMNGERK
jgi:hypothetical protein